MSTSETITRTDLTNILNEILPPADYSKVVETQSFTALQKTWTFRRIGNIVFVDASSDMNGTVPAGYTDIGTLNTSMCPKSNIYIQVGNATENAFLVVQPTGLVRFYHQTATSGAHNCGISGYGWIAGEGQASPPPSPDCADYIVEQGTSGIWTYRKWNSGRYECEAFYNFASYEVSTARGSLYSGAWVNIAFPPSVFSSAPNVTATLALDTTANAMFLQIQNVLATGVNMRLVSSGSMAANSAGYAHIQVKGRWK